MSNFKIDSVYGMTTYKEPEDTLMYRGEVMLSSEYDDGRVGLCMSMYGGRESVTVGLKDEADVQQFLYAAAMRAGLIEDGDPLVLLKQAL